MKASVFHTAIPRPGQQKRGRDSFTRFPSKGGAFIGAPIARTTWRSFPSVPEGLSCGGTGFLDQRSPPPCLREGSWEGIGSRRSTYSGDGREGVLQCRGTAPPSARRDRVQRGPPILRTRRSVDIIEVMTRTRGADFTDALERVPPNQGACPLIFLRGASSSGCKHWRTPRSASLRKCGRTHAR